jgi:ARG and Rhodanese-Phosphatase-superfamily-associated Protein domain
MSRRPGLRELVLLWMVLAIPLALFVVKAQEAGQGAQQRPVDNKRQATDFRLSGPYTHENLTVFLVHGKDTINSRKILTLQEALERKRVIVYETKDVNELAIENVSRDEDVFVQSGDIVKGGEQDRMLSTDLIVPPRSGRIKIAAFCVEQGRWSKRGTEAARNFETSEDRIVTKDLKVAANISNSQGEVWSKVAEAQDKLSENVQATVNAQGSATSLQLSLENKQLQQVREAYLRKLVKIVEGQGDVIGYAFAINGKVNSADIYASSQLFKKLWPKLLRATAVEAIAELRKGQSFDAVSREAVETFLAEAERGRASEKGVTARVKVVTRESEQGVLFETIDAQHAEAWIHRSYVTR